MKNLNEKLLRKCSTHKDLGLTYAGWILWATDQEAKGVEQTQCPKCGLWFYPEEM